MHSPLTKEIDAADTLVFFIHGFMGSPNQFHELAEAVYAQGCSVAAPLLPGHGYVGKSFFRVKLEDWENHVQAELDRFVGKYQRVFLVGHSMGGLLALNASLQQKNNVCGVFLLSAPMKVNLGLRSVFARIRIWSYPNKNPIKAAYLRAKSVSLFHLGPGPYYAVNKLAKKTGVNLGAVRVPVVIVNSTMDETVAFKSADIFYQGLSHAPKTKITLKQSRHAYYPQQESAIIRTALLDFVTKN